MAVQLLVYNGTVQPADVNSSGNSVPIRAADKSVNLGKVNSTDINNSGSVSLGLGSASGTATVDKTATTWLCDATSAAFAITLPAAATVAGMLFNFVKVDGSANAVTVTGNGSENINGANTHALASQYSAVSVQSNGTEWFILGSH